MPFLQQQPDDYPDTTMSQRPDYCAYRRAARKRGFESGRPVTRGELASPGQQWAAGL